MISSTNCWMIYDLMSWSQQIRAFRRYVNNRLLGIVNIFGGVNWQNSENENGKSSTDKWRPVRWVPNSLLNSVALEPVINTGNLRKGWWTNVSHVGTRLYLIKKGCWLSALLSLCTIGQSHPFQSLQFRMSSQWNTMRYRFRSLHNW